MGWWSPIKHPEWSGIVHGASVEIEREQEVEQRSEHVGEPMVW